MFTGLIEKICEVKSVRSTGGGMKLSINLGGLADDIKVGDSMAINGVCLTVAQLAGGAATFDISGETLARSTLGKLRPAAKVNVERSMKADGRFGGHFVLGHVDGVATIKAIERKGQFADIKFATGPELLENMVAKGSVTVDGISLTTANVDKGSFGAAIIPETLEKTTLGKVKIGDKVNVETDIIVKTVKSELSKILPAEEKLTIGKLKELGF